MHDEDFLNSWQMKNTLSRIIYRDGVLFRFGKPLKYVVSPDGYKEVSLMGRTFKYHRLVWRICTKEWPKGHIDHINQDKLDNSIENLRDVDISTNLHNIRQSNRQNQTGLRGVSPYRGKYMATLSFKGKRHYLGLYDTPELAREAYELEKARLLAQEPSHHGPEEET